MRAIARTMGGLGAIATGLALAAPAFAAGAIEGETQTQATNWHAIGMFLVFVLMTLAITKWAASRTKSAADF